MRVREEFILREIAGDYVIIPTGETVLEFNGLITVNEAGEFLWQQLQNEISKENLVKRLCEEYEVESDTAEKDVDEFLTTLRDYKILSDLNGELYEG